MFDVTTTTSPTHCCSILFDLVQYFSILFDQSFLVAVDNENNVVIYPDTKLAQTVLAEKYSSLYIRAYNADAAHNRYVCYTLLHVATRYVTCWSK